MTNKKSGRTAAQWHKIIVKATNETTRQLIELGEALYWMREEEHYFDLGFDTFDDYTRQVIGRGYRWADNIIRFYKIWGQWELPNDIAVPYTKLLIIARWLKDDDPKAVDVLYEAEELTCSQLREKWFKKRARLIKEGKIRPLRGKPERNVSFGTLVSPAESVAIRKAISVMKEQGGASNYAEALSLMADLALKHSADLRKLKAVS